MLIPTDAEAGQYATDLFRGYGLDPIIWDIRAGEEAGTVDVELHVPGEGYGFLVVTVWRLEDGAIYGEW